jgi:hypothetical protein
VVVKVFSVSLEEKVRHAGESRHPSDCNSETTVNLDSGVRRNDDKKSIESTGLEPWRFG